MNIVGGSEKDPKNKKFIIISTTVSIIIIVIICILISFKFIGAKEPDKASSKPKDKNGSQTIDKKALDEYKKAGIVKSEEELKEITEKAEQGLEENYDVSEIGDIPKGSTTESRYGKDFSKDKIQEIAKNEFGYDASSSGSKSEGRKSTGSGSTNGSKDGSGTSSDKNKEGQNNGSPSSGGTNPNDGGSNGPGGLGGTNQGGKQDQKDETGISNIPSLDMLIVAATLETQTSMKIIKETINENLKDPKQNYDAFLLKNTLESIHNGNLNERADIDNLTYNDFLSIAKNWLYFNHNKKFSWKMVTKSPGIYDKILNQKSYEKDFSKISNQVVTVLNPGEKSIDNQLIVFNMAFTSNGKTYKGSYTIIDNMPRLVDLTTI